VSCTSAASCTAAGAYTNSTGTTVTLAERWNGTAWASQKTPSPGGAEFSQLFAVSCTSASACTATGYYYNGANTARTLAERWNGTAWAIQPTPSPGGAQTSELDAVSCASAWSCMAVGDHYASSAQGTLVERWNGTAWAIQKAPSPGGVFGSYLDGVSCTSASACTAVGYYYNGGVSPLALAERWNGTAWAIQPTPTPGSVVLEAVSCTSASSCTATGFTTNNSTLTQLTLVERWNGKAWAIQKSPSPGGGENSELVGVSCTSASACTAAGFQFTSAFSGGTLAERWNGKAWAIQPTASPGGAETPELQAVSCTSASACTATGVYDTSGDTPVMMAERWNGTAWAIQPTPSPGGALGSGLVGVSCTSASACTAAGWYYTDSTYVTLVERWKRHG
jgi:hypothetical protein